MGMSYSDYVTGLISACYDAGQGKISEESESCLAEEVIGGFAHIPIVGKNVELAAKNRSWYALAGALGSCLAINESNSNQLSSTINLGDINAISSSTSSAHSSVEIHLAFKEARRGVESLTDEVLAKEEKAILKSLLTDVEDAEGDDAKASIMKVLKFVGDKAFDVFVPIGTALVTKAAGL